MFVVINSFNRVQADQFPNCLQYACMNQSSSLLFSSRSILVSGVNVWLCTNLMRLHVAACVDSFCAGPHRVVTGPPTRSLLSLSPSPRHPSLSLVLFHDRLPRRKGHFYETHVVLLGQSILPEAQQSTSSMSSRSMSDMTDRP